MSIKNNAKRALLAVFNDSLVSGVARSRRRLKYGGSTYECPCCSGQFRTFLPGIDSLHPDRHRDGILCPECNSLTRQRLLYLFLRDTLNAFERPRRVLHCAPEPSLRARFKESAAIDYIAADIDPDDFSIKVNLTDTIFRDDVFDLVICSHVLEHIPEDRTAVREITRILKPGGTALFMVPLDPARETTYEDWTIQAPADRLRAFGQEDHVRVYGRDFVSRLEQPDASLKERTCSQFVSENDIDRYRLDPGELIFECTKRVH